MKLELNNLTCGYEKKVIIKDINFMLNSGDICCILGENGVGKTTLFKTILKLLPPISGTVFIDDENIQKWSAKKMSTKCAYVSQSHIPSFPYTVREVIMIGRMGQMSPFSNPSKKDEEIVDDIIRELDLEAKADTSYMHISGGERQLVMIGKAMAQQPECLVLDEPTANLDYGNKVLVLNTLKYLSEKGLCIIFTTHDPEQALLLDAKTIILFRDSLAEKGKASEIVNDKLLKQAYNTDIRVVEIIDDNGNPVRVCIPLLK